MDDPTTIFNSAAEAIAAAERLYEHVQIGALAKGLSPVDLSSLADRIDARRQRNAIYNTVAQLGSDAWMRRYVHLLFRNDDDIRARAALRQLERKTGPAVGPRRKAGRL
jgi:hypothetical protein